MASETKYRTFRDVEEGYFRDHPEEITPYLNNVFEGYAQDGNADVLLAALHSLARAKGVSLIEKTIDKQDLFLDDVSAALHALGYRLMPVPFENGPE